MYNPGFTESEHIISTAHSIPGSPVERVQASLRQYGTTANIIGLVGGLLAVACLFAPLHNGWNIRLPLYAVMVVWVLLRPRTALYLSPFAISWGSLDTVQILFNVTSADILVIMLAISWLAGFAIRSHYNPTSMSDAGPLDYDSFKSVPRYLLMATCVLLCAMLLSIVGATSIKSSLKEIVKWVEVLIVFILGTMYLRTRRQIWILVVMMCLAAVSQAFLGFAQNYLDLGPSSFVRDASLRVYGTFDQPNPFAGYINMTLPIVISLMILGRNWTTRILSGATVVLLGAVEYMTLSRGGEIAIVVAILFILTVGIWGIRKLFAVGIVGLLCIIAAYLAGVIPSHYIQPILNKLGLVQISFSSPSAADYATAERLAHWIAGINMFLSHPITGVGIGNYPDVYSAYQITIFVNSLGHAHNYYINIAAESGVIGLAAFLFFLTTIFIAAHRAYSIVNKHYLQARYKRQYPQAGMTRQQLQQLFERFGTLTNDRALAIGLIAALITVCVHNLVDDLYVHGMTILFALLIVSLIRLARVQQEAFIESNQ